MTSRHVSAGFLYRWLRLVRHRKLAVGERTASPYALRRSSNRESPVDLLTWGVSFLPARDRGGLRSALADRSRLRRRPTPRRRAALRTGRSFAPDGDGGQTDLEHGTVFVAHADAAPGLDHQPMHQRESDPAVHALPRRLGGEPVVEDPAPGRHAGTRVGHLYLHRFAGLAEADLDPRIASAARRVEGVVDQVADDGYQNPRVETRQGHPAVDVIVITAARDAESVRGALQSGTLHYLLKPFTFATLQERLLSYASMRAELQSLREPEQRQVDRVFGAIRPSPAATQAKGRSPHTADAVLRVVSAHPGGLTSAETAEAAGISRATAQRYLSYLAESGQLRLELRYGHSGRPEHVYLPVFGS